MSSAILRIAAAQYPITRHNDWSAFSHHAATWVRDAVRQRAQWLVFPEYGAMELVSLLGSEADVRAMTLADQLVGLQSYFARWQRCYAELAVSERVWIVAPSFPVADTSGQYRNQAWIFAPDGRSACQEKLIMTRFEREEWGVAGGSNINVFDTPWARTGIAVCYDSEFPLLVRRAVAAGAEIILVPSCTDTFAGYHRVRGACVARAIENQCFVVQAVTVGMAPWCAALDVNIGAAGVFVPPEQGQWDTGVLADGVPGQPGWIFADLDFDALRAVRAHGQVLNHRDWSESELSIATHVATWSRDA